MNALANAIQTSGLSGTAAEIVAALAADVEISRDATRWSYQGVAARYNADVAGTILVLLENAIADEALPVGLRATLRAELASFQLGSSDGKTGGLDFSRPERQLQMSQWVTELTALKQDAAAAAVVAVMRLGVVRGSLWTKLGLDALPTVEQVAAATDQVAAVQWLTEVVEPLVESLKAGGGSIAVVKTSLAEVLN